MSIFKDPAAVQKAASVPGASEVLAEFKDVTYIRGFFLNSYKHDLQITRDKVYLLPADDATGSNVFEEAKYIDISDIKGFNSGLAANFKILMKDGSVIKLQSFKKKDIVAAIEAQMR